MVKSSIACGLQACLGQLWTKDDYSDFTVVVDDQEFQCHKFILGACSRFLNGLLRSDMIETNQQRAVLKNMSKETFTIILNAIYKGEFGLTMDNVIQVWHATHFLDIPYLVNECENFIMENMTLLNYKDFYHHANLLTSENVVKLAKQFMIKDFEHFCTCSTLLSLSFEDILLMIDDHFLSTKSEDMVVDAIMKWANHQVTQDILKSSDEKREADKCMDNLESASNEIVVLQDEGTGRNDKDSMETLHDSNHEFSKYSEETQQLNTVEVLNMLNQSEDSQMNVIHISTEQKLIKLLKVARLCLASRECLEKLMRNPLITSNPDALNIVFESLLFHWKADCYSSNYIARYRECSGMTNVMIFVNNGLINVYSLQRNCFYTIYRKGDDDNSVELTGTQEIAVIKSKFCFNIEDEDADYYYIFDTELNKCAILAQTDIRIIGPLLSHQDKFIYIDTLGKSSNALKATNTLPCLVHVQLDDCFSVVAATIFNGDVLAFRSSENGNEVIRYNMTTQKETKLPALDGPFANISSFQQDQNFYILQQNGSLWLVVRNPSDDIVFTYLATLWNGDKPLKGVVCYAGELFVFCNPSSTNSSTSLDTENEFQTQTETFPTSLPGVFNSIRLIYFSCETRVIPMTISTSCLRKDIVR